MKYFLILITLMLTCCKKIDENGFRIYTIKEGKHKSRSRYKTTKTNYLQFEAIFDESAI